MGELEVEKIVGEASELEWTQVQDVRGDSGRVMMVVGLTRGAESTLLDLAEVGSGIVADLSAVKADNDWEEQVEKVVNTIDAEIGVRVVLALSVGTSLRICGRGAVGAYLARGGKLAKLGGDQDKWRVAGRWVEGDALLLATENLMIEAGIKEVKEALLSDEKPAEVLVPLIHAKGNKSGVAGLIAKYGEPKTVKEGWLSRWRGPMIKLPNRDRQPKGYTLWVGGIVLLLLMVMIGVGMVRRARDRAEQDYLQLETVVDQQIKEAENEAMLNPQRARTLLNDARRAADSYLESEIRQEYKLKGLDLIGKIEKANDTLFKKNTTTLSTWVDLSVLAEGLKSASLRSDGKDHLYFVDESGARIVGVNLNDRSKTTLESEEEIKRITVVEKQLWGLTQSGVMEWKDGKSEGKKVIEADEFWKTPTQIETFAGNIYVFDREQSEIWKYPTLGESYGGRRRWLAAGITPDLTKVVDMKVMGDIWLLTSSGKLLRYSRGAPTTLELVGYPYLGEERVLADPVALFVSEGAVYILERGAGRVGVVSTDGTYEAQYENEELKKADDLAVVDGRVYVLIENVVKEFGL